MMKIQEMLDILRGKTLYEDAEQIQERLNEIADTLERYHDIIMNRGA